LEISHIKLFQGEVAELWEQVNNRSSPKKLAELFRWPLPAGPITSAWIVMNMIREGLRPCGFVPPFQDPGKRGVNYTDVKSWLKKTLTKEALYTEYRANAIELDGYLELGGLFAELPPKPQTDAEQVTPAVPKAGMFGSGRADIPTIRSDKAHSHSKKFGYAEELESLPERYQRVIAYGFRGDSRSPEDLKANFIGAMTPNATRVSEIDALDGEFAAAIVGSAPDAFDKLRRTVPGIVLVSRATDDEKIAELANALKGGASGKRKTVRDKVLKVHGNLTSRSGNWKTYTIPKGGKNLPSQPWGEKNRYHGADEVTFNHLYNNRPLDLYSYVEKESFGGFISITRSIRVAKSFASGRGLTNADDAKHDGWVYAVYCEGALHVPHEENHEFELAMPGMLDWADIVGWRKVQQVDGHFEGPVYLRKSLSIYDPEAFLELYELLSGKHQEEY
jgi:hypothetical protein